MSPLQFETMWIRPLLETKRLRLQGRDLVLCVTVCWAVKWHLESSPFRPTDYNIPTLGLDGVPY
jgi:hypothetical protein